MQYIELQIGEHRIYACAVEANGGHYSAALAVNRGALQGNETVLVERHLRDGALFASPKHAMAAALESGLAWLEQGAPRAPEPGLS